MHWSRSLQNNYASIAHEYYNFTLHPTCDDLGYASAALLFNFMNTAPIEGRVCEVGAGRSALLQYVGGVESTANFFVTDISTEMLAHSLCTNTLRTHFVVCDATNLPFEASSMEIIISLLGDPYNSERFWSEASRVLKTGGLAFFTTPSWDWANAFREEAAEERVNTARFLTGEGDSLYIPSNIVTEIEQNQMMQKFGLHVVDILHFRLEQLRTRAYTSRKLTDYINSATPIVTAFCAKKEA